MSALDIGGGGGARKNSENTRRGGHSSIHRFTHGSGANSKWRALTATKAVGTLRSRTSDAYKTRSGPTTLRNSSKSAESKILRSIATTALAVPKSLEGKLAVPPSVEGEFSPSQISTFEELFSYYDSDQSGNISRAELAKVFETLGEDVSDGKLDDIIEEVDRDGDGELSWEEFLVVMSLSGASLFRATVEKVDKKLNPLKAGDDVVMTQGGVRVRGKLQRQLGLFWTVSLKNGTIAEGVALSCLSRALTSGGDTDDDQAAPSPLPVSAPMAEEEPVDTLAAQDNEPLFFPAPLSSTGEPSSPRKSSPSNLARRPVSGLNRRHSAPMNTMFQEKALRRKGGLNEFSPMSLSPTSSPNGVVLGGIKMAKLVSFGSPTTSTPLSPKKKSPSPGAGDDSGAHRRRVLDSVDSLPSSSLPSGSWSPASPVRGKDKAALDEGMLAVPPSVEGEFSPSQIVSLKELFSYYDSDQSGKIDRLELEQALEALGEDVSDGKLDDIIEEVDRDGDGELSWEEFLVVMSLSDASLFRATVEKVDKKLNPLKAGDDVVMTQGGVRVHVVLKRQLGLFWTVKPVGGGPLVRDVLPSCLARGLVAGDADAADTVSSADEPSAPAPSSLPSGTNYGGPSKPAFVPSEVNSIQYSTSHFMQSAIASSEDGRLHMRMLGGFLDRRRDVRSPLKSSDSIGSRAAALRFSSGSASDDYGSPHVNPEKKRILGSIFPGSNIECHPNGKVVILPPAPSHLSPTSTLASPLVGEGETEATDTASTTVPRRSLDYSGSARRKYKDTGLRELIERLSIYDSVRKRTQTPVVGEANSHVPTDEEYKGAAPLTSPERKEAANRGLSIIVERIEKQKAEDASGIRSSEALPADDVIHYAGKAEDDEARVAALALLTGVGMGNGERQRTHLSGRRADEHATDDENPEVENDDEAEDECRAVDKWAQRRRERRSRRRDLRTQRKNACA